MEKAIITYEMLYDTLRREKGKIELQELEKDCIVEYIDRYTNSNIKTHYGVNIKKGNLFIDNTIIDRKNIYITNVVNYRPPNNRKPEPAEIIRYSNFLREHISIIDPKILILMGSTAMESLFGSKIKISKERGIWKEVIINNKTYLTMITFHPAYLLRQPDQKKYSWSDLKEIKIKIDKLGLKM